jgi:ribosomal protein S27E
MNTNGQWRGDDMKSNFDVECPLCGNVNDLLEMWNDEFKDDSEITDADCGNCGTILPIKTDLIIKLSVDLEVWEDEQEMM